jgi:hypothetical protein
MTNRSDLCPQIAHRLRAWAIRISLSSVDGGYSNKTTATAYQTRNDPRGGSRVVTSPGQVTDWWAPERDSNPQPCVDSVLAVTPPVCPWLREQELHLRSLDYESSEIAASPPREDVTLSEFLPLRRDEPRPHASVPRVLCVQSAVVPAIVFLVTGKLGTEEVHQVLGIARRNGERVVAVDDAQLPIQFGHVHLSCVAT